MLENDDPAAQLVRGHFISPAGKNGDAVYDHIVSPAAMMARIVVYRTDRRDDDSDHTIEAIDTADFLIADISGNDTNVIFELATARAAGRGIVMVSEKSSSVPFPLKDYPIIRFEDPSDTESAAQAARAVSEALLAHIREGRNRGWSPFPSIRRLQEQEFARENALASLKKLRDERRSAGKKFRSFDAFISYTRRDRPLVERLERHLKKRGVSVWYDRRLDLTPGVDFTAEIEGALAFAKKVVVLWSANSQSSTWVFAEATLAREAGKYLPVQAQTCEIPSAFRDLHSLDLGEFFAAGNSARTDNLIKSIRAKRT